MMWKSKYSLKWRRKFAFLPIHVDRKTEVVWLQYYWERYVKTNYGNYWERVSEMPRKVWENQK